MRVGVGPGAISSIGPGAGIAGGKLRPVRKTYSAPLPLITGAGNPAFLQVNPSTTGKAGSGSHSPREGANSVAPGANPYLGSGSGGLFHSSTTTQLQTITHPGVENNFSGMNQDFYSIRQQIRANVLQKSKEKQEKKMMVNNSNCKQQK